MVDIKSIFQKKKSNIKNDLPQANSDNIVKNISNWYADRYNSVLIQRNLLLLLLILSVLMVIISSIMVGNVSSTFKIQPFVIEVEDKTGITNIVNPLSRQELTTNEVLNRYFIMRYIKARESYNFETYKYNYFTVVRLLSKPDVYGRFKRFIDSGDSLIQYTNRAAVDVVFRSIQFFPPAGEGPNANDQRATVRFTVLSDSVALKGGTDGKLHKILSLTFRYEQTEMNEDERSENPLGFFITSYVWDIENLDPSK
jgi:type IV secretion system protein VirB8